jgi:hypothetical protein
MSGVDKPLRLCFTMFLAVVLLAGCASESLKDTPSTACNFRVPKENEYWHRTDGRSRRGPAPEGVVLTDRPLRWRRSPTIWIHPKLRALDPSYAAATTVFKEAGYQPAFLNEYEAADIAVRAFSLSKRIDGSVIWQGGLFPHRGGPNGDFEMDSFFSQISPPQPLPTGKVLPLRPYASVRFPLTRNQENQRNVDGSVAYDASGAIVAAECFVNIELPSREQTILVAECLLRSAGLLEMWSADAAASLTSKRHDGEKLPPPSAIGADMKCIRALYQEG